MKNRKMWAGFLALVVVLGAMLGLWLGTRPELAEGSKTITVTVIHGDGSEAEFVYETKEEYLASVLLEEELVQGEAGAFGLMISAVDGETAVWEENKSYWALYVGEEYATTGADGIVLTDGGQYSLVYTIG